MSAMEERIQQIRRVSWSVREKLCLATAVARCGDQNWLSVSRALKPFAESDRPPDWFSQQNCAAQYGSLLESLETIVDTPVKTIIRKLTEERKMELHKEIELKLKQKEQEAIIYTQWLKERKIEIERAFRSITKVPQIVTVQKRKASDSLDTSITESSQESEPALSPLTSTLKTEGHEQNVVSSASQETTSTPVASEPPLGSFAKPDTSVLAVTSTITNSATEENDSLKQQIPAEESLLESSKINEKNAQVEHEEILESKEDKFDEAKPDKPGKVKRHNSHTNKKKEKHKKVGRKRKLKDSTEEVSPKSRRRFSFPATPSDSIASSSSSGAILDDDQAHRAWKKSVMLIYDHLVTYKCASLFLKPITEEQAPGYHSIVHQPMDLQTIRKKIENGLIRTTQEFHRDVLLMFLNALMYNKRNGTVYNLTNQMLKESLQEIEILLAAQEQDETPVRRQTRASTSGRKRKRKGGFLTQNKKQRN